jgi:hypothetical protein
VASADHKREGALRARAAAAALGLAALAVGVLVAFQGVSNVWLLGAGMAVLPFLVLVDRRVLVYLCFLSTFLIDWLTLTLGVLPSQSQWLIELCLLMLLVRSLGEAFRRRSIRMPLVIAGVFVAFTLSAVVGIIGGLSWVVVLLGMRKYLRFPLLALCLYIAPMGAGFEKGLWRIILAAAGLQVLVSVGQLLITGPGDTASGTFGRGGTGFEAIFLVGVASTVILTNVLVGGRARAIDIVSGIVLMVPAMIGSVVAAFFMAPACLAFGTLAYGRRFTRVLWTLVATGLVLAAVAPYALEFTTSVGYVNATRLLSSPAAMLEYDQLATAQGRLGRIDQILVAGGLTLGSDVSKAMFGLGPASASPSSLGPGFSGPLADDVLVRWVETSVALTLLELGLVGLVAYIAVGVYAVVVSIRSVRSVMSPGKAVIAAYTGIAGFLMLVAGAYSVPWTIPGTALPFWVCLGTMMSWRPAESSEEAE